MADLYFPVLTWNFGLCIHTGTLEPLAGLNALQSLELRSLELTGKWLPLNMDPSTWNKAGEKEEEEESATTSKCR